MFKWVVMFVCALSLTACGSMSNPTSSGYSGSTTASGIGDGMGPQPGLEWNEGNVGPWAAP